MSMLHKLSGIWMDGSELLGANAGIAAVVLCSWQNRDYSGTQDVVEVALYMSLSNNLGMNQSNGSIVLGKCDCCHVQPSKVAAKTDMERVPSRDEADKL
jgi:hypothetical protein